MLRYFLKSQKNHPQFGQITFCLLLANEPGASGPKDCHFWRVPGVEPERWSSRHLSSHVVVSFFARHGAFTSHGSELDRKTRDRGDPRGSNPHLKPHKGYPGFSAARVLNRGSRRPGIEIPEFLGGPGFKPGIEATQDRAPSGGRRTPRVSRRPC